MIFVPPPLDAGDIMLLGCPTGHLSRYSSVHLTDHKPGDWQTDCLSVCQIERVKGLTKKYQGKHYNFSGLKSSLKKCLNNHHRLITKRGLRIHQNLTEA